jgi:hypothetical protein
VVEETIVATSDQLRKYKSMGNTKNQINGNSRLSLNPVLSIILSFVVDLTTIGFMVMMYLLMTFWFDKFQNHVIQLLLFYVVDGSKAFSL